MAKGTQRYTMILDDAALDSVERLQATFGLGNKAETYQLAIRVLSWVAEQQAEGYEIGRYHAENDQFQPLLMPLPFNAKRWRDHKEQS